MTQPQFNHHVAPIRTGWQSNGLRVFPLNLIGKVSEDPDTKKMKIANDRKVIPDPIDDRKFQE